MDQKVDQNRLEEQVKKLLAEKELLQKQVNVLNECLSIDELKAKISDLEVKKKSLLSFENVIVQLRAEVEPLNYLKALLNDKLANANKGPTELTKAVLQYAESLEFNDNLSKEEIILSRCSGHDELEKPGSVISLPVTPNSTNTLKGNEESLDGSIQLLDQYDVVTEEDMFNFFSEENASKAETTVFVQNSNVISSTDSHNSHLEEENSKIPIECSKPSTSNFHNIPCAEINNQSLQLSKQKVDSTSTQIINDETFEEQLSSQAGSDKSNDKKAHIETFNLIEWTNNLNYMDLKLDILRGIYSLGSLNPTSLQQNFIQHCIKGQDIIIYFKANREWQAIMSIPVLQRVITELKECQALILVPTREIAVQIEKVINDLSEFMDLTLCIGGDNVPRKLSVIPHIVIGTPAGISNMIACNSLSTQFISTVMMYQIDEMLPYYVVIEEVMQKLKVIKKQITLLASDKVDQIMDVSVVFLQDPLIFLNEDERKEEKIAGLLPNQFIMGVLEEFKFSVVCGIICNELERESVIIYCNTFDKAQWMYENMLKIGLTVSTFDLKMNEYERNKKLTRYLKRQLRVLIVADPIKSICFPKMLPRNIVINYELPADPRVYTNRIINFTTVINFIGENDETAKMTIDKYCKSLMRPMPLDLTEIFNV